MLGKNLITLLIFFLMVGFVGAEEEMTGQPSVDRTAWAGKLAELKQADWRQAFAVGNELASLPPDTGFQILKESWGKVANIEARQQLLKAFFYALPYPLHHRNHAHILDVLHLGVTDPSLKVQDWAFNYLQQIAFQDFAEDYTAYLKWYEQSRQRPVEEVMRENCVALVGKLAKAKDKQRETLGRFLDDTQYTFRDVTSVRQIAIEAGLREVLIKWLTDPESGQDAIRGAGRALRHLELDEDYLRRSILPLTKPGNPDGVRYQAIYLLRNPKNKWAVDYLLDLLVTSLENEDEFRHLVVNIAGTLAEIGDSRVIPTMIGVIDTDNSYDTVYGVGHFGLSPLTGVRYDESHDGNWWREWWKKNKARFPEDVRKLEIPDLPKTKAGKAYEEKQSKLGTPRIEETLDTLLEKLVKQVESSETQKISNIAEKIAKFDDPRAIPTLIAVIEADNTYDTVYGVGYFGLNPLTGVRYDESHDGAWWREWWEKNKARFPEEVGKLEIPKLKKPKAKWQRKPPEAEDVADIPSQDLQASDDANKRYFLIGPEQGAKAPANGFRLLLVFPGGDGGPDFHPFVKRIYKNSLSSEFLVAQLVAPQWSPEQFKNLVWPTKTNPWQGMKFSTEEFVEAVIEDVGKKCEVDGRYIFTLGWSSGGPACYAISLQETKSVTGSFIAMSVFKPNQLPPVKNAKGHAYFILHSPEDFIPIKMAEHARDTLGEHGAKVELMTYAGGHGWRGDVYGNIRQGIQWLEKNQ